MNLETNELRIGVYVYYCGSNIAGFLNCDAVSNYASTLPDVVISRTNKLTCQDILAQIDAFSEEICT